MLINSKLRQCYLIRPALQLVINKTHLLLVRDKASRFNPLFTNRVTFHQSIYVNVVIAANPDLLVQFSAVNIHA